MPYYMMTENNIKQRTTSVLEMTFCASLIGKELALAL